MLLRTGLPVRSGLRVPGVVRLRDRAEERKGVGCGHSPGAHG